MMNAAGYSRWAADNRDMARPDRSSLMEASRARVEERRASRHRERFDLEAIDMDKDTAQLGLLQVVYCRR